MKSLCICIGSVALLTCSQLFAGVERQASVAASDELDPHRIEFALETGYLFGAINPPADYQIGALFLTERIRWGVIRSDSWLRGYHQFYISAIAEPIFKGIENRYFGFNVGFRYNFVQPHSRFIPYISGGVGAGGIDSHPEVSGGQGQDFTFNILSAAGISYILNDHWKLDVGALYQHLSNGGQTDPNPSLNLFGPQVGASYSF
jgi:lipid A 3-O-deacylase